MVHRLLGQVVALAPDERDILLTTLRTWLDCGGNATATACVQPYDRVTQVQCRLRRAWHKALDRLEAIRRARQPPAPAQAQASHPRPPKEEEFIDTADEYFKQDFRNAKNFRLARKLQVWWSCNPDHQPQLLSKLYKGEGVEEFPADDPAEIVNRYINHGPPNQPL